VERGNKNAEEVNAVREADIAARQLGEAIRSLPYSKATAGINFGHGNVKLFRNSQK
jgi:hypothetical protein